MTAGEPKFVLYPDDGLTTESGLFKYSPEMDARIAEMFKIMYLKKGIGLAAPQVGWNVRLFVMNETADPVRRESEKVFWNPAWEFFGDMVDGSEGCLSLPGVHGRVRRRSEVLLKAETPNGTVEEVFKGWAARIVQHEIDHLGGLLIIDKMSPADLKQNRPAIKDLEDRNK